MSAIEHAIREANDGGRLALAVFATAGFPTKPRFVDVMTSIAPSIDVLEIGVPFSDPMADGISIQQASQKALKQGVTLRWIFDVVAATDLPVPVVLMSYLNPLLAFGLENLADATEDAGVAGFIVPDLPYEEASELHDVLGPRKIDLIQLVTPATPTKRLNTICESSTGFIYAVTMTGTTGGEVTSSQTTFDYLARVKQAATCPVLAGFGIRKSEHIAKLAGHADGVIVGSAIMDVLANDQDPTPFVETLRAATVVERDVAL